VFSRLSAQGIRVSVFCLAIALAGCATTPGGGGRGGSTTPNIWPIQHPEARLSSPFGMRKQPGTGKMRLHKGLDIQAPEGTPVYVTANGVVSFSGQQGDYGNVIVVEHDSRTATAYAHLKKRRVGQGDAVQQGQHIGDVGRTGNATANHLHYEVRKEGQPVDPMGYLAK
jgi:murein DD-endopeptidase MepM/ murein hydrolase activator NlpD